MKAKPLAWFAAVLLLLALLPVLLRRESAEPPQTSNPKPQTPNSEPQTQPPAHPEPETPNSKPETSNPALAHPDAELAALETLAATDHAAALARALAEPDIPRRDELLQAALRGWASADIRAAGHWARNQTYLIRDIAFAALFNGGAKNPAAAEKYARDLIATDPARAGDYGGYLIHGLHVSGHFRAAAKFALADNEQNEKGWLIAAYHGWAWKEPKNALFAADEIGNPAQQRTARHAVYSAWSQIDPAGLAAIAIGYPEGDDRKLALTEALRTWIEKDPAAAADWIAKQKFSPEMEAALED